MSMFVQLKEKILKDRNCTCNLSDQNMLTTNSNIYYHRLPNSLFTPILKNNLLDSNKHIQLTTVCLKTCTTIQNISELFLMHEFNLSTQIIKRAFVKHSCKLTLVLLNRQNLTLNQLTQIVQINLKHLSFEFAWKLDDCGAGGDNYLRILVRRIYTERG